MTGHAERGGGGLGGRLQPPPPHILTKIMFLRSTLERGVELSCFHQACMIHYLTFTCGHRRFYRAHPHRQFHTLPHLLNSQATLSNSYPNPCMPSREAVYTIFMMLCSVTRGRGVNPQPTTWEADMLTTEPL